MIDSKSLERLHNSEDFLSFLNELQVSREMWISAMHDAPTERIQQISGRVLALDEILSMAGYAALKERWDAIRR